jgi:hypothetical protein
VIASATRPGLSGIGTWPQPASGISCAPGIEAAKRGAVSAPSIASSVPKQMRTGTRISPRPLGALAPVVAYSAGWKPGAGREVLDLGGGVVGRHAPGAAVEATEHHAAGGGVRRQQHRGRRSNQASCPQQFVQGDDVHALRGGFEPGGAEHDRATGASPARKLERDPAAQRVAGDVHGFEPGPVELGLDRVGQGGDGRRALMKRRGGAKPGDVDRQDVVLAGQDREHRLPRAPAEAEPVDQQERIAVAPRHAPTAAVAATGG